MSTAGVTTAATVYQNTLATVGGRSADGLGGTGTLTVANVTGDDYGAYTGDGINDA